MNTPKKGLYLLFIFIFCLMSLMALGCDNGPGNPTGEKIGEVAIEANPVNDLYWVIMCSDSNSEIGKTAKCAGYHSSLDK